MTEFAENFSKDKRFLRTNWLCRCGNERESEDHITKECLIYDDIRKEYEDLNDDSQLASFFSRVLERREWSTTSTKARTRRTPWTPGATDVIARLGVSPNRADCVVQTT